MVWHIFARCGALPVSGSERGKGGLDEGSFGTMLFTSPSTEAARAKIPCQSYEYFKAGVLRVAETCQQ